MTEKIQGQMMGKKWGYELLTIFYHRKMNQKKDPGGGFHLIIR